LVFGRSTAIHRGNLIVAGVFSFRVVAMVGMNEAPMPHHLGGGWLKLHFLRDAIRNSSVVSSIVALCGVDSPL
jgi:hypothetical protein